MIELQFSTNSIPVALSIVARAAFQQLVSASLTEPVLDMPGPFSSRSFAATLPNSLAARYRKALQKHPFLLFGLPFMATIVAGSFMLTPATALRYERYDRKNQQITHEQAMGLRQERRKVNMRDEYYRLQAKDLEDWEQRRVKRLPGEPDGIL